jgi:myosin-5
LFRCDAEALEDSICKKKLLIKKSIVTGYETITKCLDPEAAAVRRDALARIVYAKLFDW